MLLSHYATNSCGHEDMRREVLCQLHGKTCVPRKEGGLSFKQLRAWNCAAIGKLLWRIHSNANDIWVQRIKHKMKRKCVWHISIPQDCSWSWRELLQLRCLFKHNMFVKIGDGRECSLFL